MEFGAFILLVIVGFLIYLPSTKLGMTSDFYHWIERYDRMGWQGWLHSFDDWSLKYVSHGVAFTLYKLFGLHSFSWWFIFVGFHVLNSFFVYKITDQLFKKNRLVAVIAAVLFLTSPFQHEAVIWKATIHYQIATLCTLSNCFLFLLLFKKVNIRIILSIIVLFGLSMYALESVFVLPGLFILIYMYKYFEDRKSIFSITTFAFKILLPLVVLIGSFFLFTKIKLDQFIGHYGGVHTNFDLALLGNSIYQYVLKFGLYFRYSLNESSNYILHWANDSTVSVIIFFVAALTSIILFVIKRTRLLGLFLLLFFVALFPVLNLETPFNYSIQADRYGYLASAFFYAFVAIGLFGWTKKIYHFLMAGLFILHITLLQQTIGEWEKAEIIKQNIIEQFPNEREKEFFILNIPDNINGAYIFRQGLWQALKIYKQVNQSHINVVSWTNRREVIDPVHLSVDSNRIEYRHHSGTWIHHLGEGIQDRNRQYLQIDRAENNLSYTLEFKNQPKNFKVLYLDSLKWKEIELHH